MPVAIKPLSPSAADSFIKREREGSPPFLAAKRLCPDVLRMIVELVGSGLGTAVAGRTVHVALLDVGHLALAVAGGAAGHGFLLAESALPVLSGFNLGIENLNGLAAHVGRNTTAALAASAAVLTPPSCLITPSRVFPRVGDISPDMLTTVSSTLPFAIYSPPAQVFLRVRDFRLVRGQFFLPLILPGLFVLIGLGVINQKRP